MRELKIYSSDTPLTRPFSLSPQERFLSRQRSPSYAFRPDWLYASNLDGAYRMFEQILEKNGEVMDGQMGEVRKRVRAEDVSLGEKLVVLEARWRAGSPEWGAVATSDVGAAGSEWRAIFDLAMARVGSGAGGDGEGALSARGLRAALQDPEVELLNTGPYAQ